MSKVIDHDEVIQVLKVTSKILWLNSKCSETGTCEVEFAEVTSVNNKNKNLDICWYEGHTACNETIEIENILAIEDKTIGKELSIGGYTGKGLLTKYGQDYVVAKENLEKQAVSTSRKNKIK